MQKATFNCDNNLELNSKKPVFTAQWYRVLLEKEVTMEESKDGTMEFIRLRFELASPSTEWEVTLMPVSKKI